MLGVYSENSLVGLDADRGEGTEVVFAAAFFSEWVGLTHASHPPPCSRCWFCFRVLLFEILTHHEMSENPAQQGTTRKIYIVDTHASSDKSTSLNAGNNSTLAVAIL